MEEDSEKEVKGSTGGRSARDRDWTKGNILTNIWLLAWPIMISSSFQMAGPTVDMIWVGRLGTASIAGVGIAGMAVQLVMGLKMGVTTGARAMVARFWGAGDAEGASHVAKQSFIISAAYSLVMAVIGMFFAEQIMRLFQLEESVIAEGAAYMRIMFIGQAAMSFFMMVEGVMQASGDTQTPMRIMIVVRLFHIAICPFLIFGWWIFPRLGVRGAAITNIVSQSGGTVLALWFLASGRTRLRVTLRNFRLDLNIIWRMVKIGLPAAGTMIQWNLANTVLVWIMARFGTIAVAAHAVCQRADMFLHMPSNGLGMAAGVIAGQNLGAGQPERAERTGWTAVGLVQGVMVISAVVILLWSENIIRIFSSDPELVAVGSIFLKIALVSYFVLGVVSVLFQCLVHVGDTLPPLLIIVPAVWLVQMPMAYFLPEVTNLGVYAVRWAIVASLGAAMVAYIIYFRHGRWKRKMV